ncbi:MAG: Gfo/Idh/MocA family oxidoreductase [Lentisphaeria bacterium]|nr:Gfo/Idh/MocA family oxidoreductase [Lentisphaeria bacterium]
MKQIRVAIIGQGRSGRGIHGDYLPTDDRFQVVAVVDEIAKRREYARGEHGCDTYADHQRLFDRDDIDLIVNATYSHLHAPISLEILEAGYNLLSEKPLADNTDDVDRLIEASERTGKLFAIYQQSRYAPYFQKVQEVIDSGVLGRIVQISIRFNGHSRRWDWQTLTGRMGGNLLNTGPHPLDQALQLFGEGMPNVTCFMDNTEASLGDAENHLKLLLSGEGHPLIDLEVSSCCAYPPFMFTVYGSRGGMTVTRSSAEWRYYKQEECPEQKLTTDPLEDGKGVPCYCSEDVTWHTGKWPTEGDAGKNAAYSSAAAPTQGGMTGKFYSMLYNTLTKGTPLEITPQQVRRQIAVIAECQRQNPRIWGASIDSKR